VPTVFTAAALQDLESVREFIGSDNPDAARATVEALLAAARSIEALPGRGRPGRVPHTRELVVPPYIVVYTVEAPRVVILRILHGARKWP
jgi:toxin ParE1/3/4